MKVLITNHHLSAFYGSETATATIAGALRDAGHDVRLLTMETGPFADLLQKEGFVVLRTDKMPEAGSWKPDVIHAHHSIMAIVARGYWPDVPMVFISHGVLPLLENPPSIDLGIGAYGAVSEEVAAALMQRHRIEKVAVIPNGIDTERFAPQSPINPQLKNILVLSNRVTDRNVAVIRQAAASMGLDVFAIGQRFQVVRDIAKIINRVDLVISLGRGILEAMACGRAAVVYDYNGGDGIVTPESYQEIKKCNFSGRWYHHDYTAEALALELKRYSPLMGEHNRRIIMDHHDIRSHVSAYEALYNQAMAGSAHRQAHAVPLKELLFYQNIIRNSSQVHTDYHKLKDAHADLQKKIANLKPRIKKIKDGFDQELRKLAGRNKRTDPALRREAKPEHEPAGGSDHNLPSQRCTDANILYPPKIIGLTRIRNEALIIRETLDHMASFCHEVYIYDDCSTDDTVAICSAHPIVRGIIRGSSWDSDRKRAEWQNRKAVLELGRKNAGPEDWFVYMDADERIDFDFTILPSLEKSVIGIKMKLFDFYITPEDVYDHYSRRKYCGPEYRSILIAFRNLPTLDYSSPDQREVHLNHAGTILQLGYVKHYGKGISIEQWEETCDYYANHFPEYSVKWRQRKGKAVHRKSSFGYPLITWDQKDRSGIPLTREIEQNNIYENSATIVSPLSF